jgi:hypothetical protein
MAAKPLAYEDVTLRMKNTHPDLGALEEPVSGALAEKNLTEAEYAKMKEKLKTIPNSREIVNLVQGVIDKRSGLGKFTTSSSKLGYLSKTEENEIIKNIQLYFSLKDEDNFKKKYYFEKWRGKCFLTKARSLKTPR